MKAAQAEAPTGGKPSFAVIDRLAFRPGCWVGPQALPDHR
ncbi:hypothetical protein MMEU_2344 [Mycobacterium marinum str. Europe]|nr:hypothetical protein MMEU_2344 [Mycobacterium marinum str. Europe]